MSTENLSHEDTAHFKVDPAMTHDQLNGGDGEHHLVEKLAVDFGAPIELLAKAGYSVLSAGEGSVTFQRDAYSGRLPDFSVEQARTEREHKGIVGPDRDEDGKLENLPRVRVTDKIRRRMGAVAAGLALNPVFARLPGVGNTITTVERNVPISQPVERIVTEERVETQLPVGEYAEEFSDSAESRFVNPEGYAELLSRIVETIKEGGSIKEITITGLVSAEDELNPDAGLLKESESNQDLGMERADALAAVLLTDIAELHGEGVLKDLPEKFTITAPEGDVLSQPDYMAVSREAENQKTTIQRLVESYNNGDVQSGVLDRVIGGDKRGQRAEVTFEVPDVKQETGVTTKTITVELPAPITPSIDLVAYLPSEKRYRGVIQSRQRHSYPFHGRELPADPSVTQRIKQPNNYRNGNNRGGVGVPRARGGSRTNKRG